MILPPLRSTVMKRDLYIVNTEGNIDVLVCCVVGCLDGSDSIDGEGRDNLIEKYPFFSASTIPANTYNNKEDVESVFVYNIMLVNKDVSDDMVYDMLDCIFSTQH